jgi:hypothetical protein
VTAGRDEMFVVDVDNIFLSDVSLGADHSAEAQAV